MPLLADYTRSVGSSFGPPVGSAFSRLGSSPCSYLIGLGSLLSHFPFFSSVRLPRSYSLFDYASQRVSGDYWFRVVRSYITRAGYCSRELRLGSPWHSTSLVTVSSFACIAERNAP